MRNITQSVLVGKMRLVFSVVVGCLCMVQSLREGDLRLMHTNQYLQKCGRVEVFHNESWGTVCHNSWNKRDADVVCRQLGYRKGSRFRCHAACFGQGKGKIWMDNLACPRNVNRLMLCDYRGWGEHDCTHAEDVGVCCKGETTLPLLYQTTDTRVRLSCPCAADECNSCADRLRAEPGDCNATTAALEGMVEISFGDLWIPVSEDGWSAAAAQVACGELGYPHALNISTAFPNDLCTAEETAALKQSSGINNHVVKSVECNGNEATIANCTLKTGIGSASFCAAKLRCGFSIHQDCPESNMTHRLRAGALPWVGRVEVKKDGSWGTVYDDTFGQEEANVACRAAGYGTAITLHKGSKYGRGIGSVHYQNVRCNGDEKSLDECETVSGSGLGHERDVGVECRQPTPCSTPMRMAETTVLDDHMTSGYPVYVGDGGPGLVCAGDLDRLAARVVCASTTGTFLYNMSTADSATAPGGASGVFYRGSVECTGEEADFAECSVSLQTISQCPNGLVQMLTCTSCVPDLVPDLEKFRYSLQRHSSPFNTFAPAITRIPMYYLQCALEENCLSSSAHSASLNDQRTLLKFDSVTYNWGLCPFLPNLSPEDWIFHDCHSHYHSFEAFVDFNLVDPDTGEKVAEGHKASFCLEDTTCAEGYSIQYACTDGLGEQGISANCGDRYPRYLDCQWIDITGVESGVYLISQNMNPHRDAEESDYRNNVITCKISIYVESSSLFVSDCWQSDHV